MNQRKKSQVEIPEDIRDRMCLIQQMATLNDTLQWQASPHATRNKKEYTANYFLLSKDVYDLATANNIARKLKKAYHLDVACVESKSKAGSYRISADLSHLKFDNKDTLVNQFAQRNKELCALLNKLDTKREDPTWQTTSTRASILPFIYAATSGYYNDDDESTQTPHEALKEALINVIMYLAKGNKVPQEMWPSIKENAAKIFDNLEQESHKLVNYYKVPAGSLPQLHALANPTNVPGLKAALVGLLSEKGIPRDVAKMIGSYGILNKKDTINIIKAKKQAGMAKQNADAPQPQGEQTPDNHRRRGRKE